MARRSLDPDAVDWSSKEEKEVRAVLDLWERARQDRAQQEMAATAAARAEQRYLEASDGFGGFVALMVHPASFHHWGQKVGYECWSNDQFKREYWRDNPACRVKAQSRNPTVVVPQSSPLAGAAKRFTKSYG